MVEIEEKTVQEMISDKTSDLDQVSEMLDDDMDKLIYSGSDVTSNDTRSVGLNDDEFKDALENWTESIDNGKLLLQ